MKQIEVSILGQHYVLSCPENNESALHEAVKRVDAEMAKIHEAGRIRPRERIAVLAALNLAYSVAESPEGEAALKRRDEQNRASTVLHPEDEALVDRLVHKLDETLGEDGCLL
jgi:cell division protein ZapA